MFVKPARDGMVVRHPNTMRILDAEGEEVLPSTYWSRRLRDGDVVLAKPVKKPTSEDKQK